MQLVYRGLPYHMTNESIETVETEMTGHFLGQSYAIRRPVHLFGSNSKTNLKFRGIAYTSER